MSKRVQELDPRIQVSMPDSVVLAAHTQQQLVVPIVCCNQSHEQLVKSDVVTDELLRDCAEEAGAENDHITFYPPQLACGQ